MPNINFPEMPNEEEQLKNIQKQIKELKEKLAIFNLPDNLLGENITLPDSLTEEQKKEILEIQKNLKGLESEENFLKDKKQIK